MTQTEAPNDMNAVTTTDENNKNRATETALSVLSTWISKDDDDDDDDKDSDPFRIVRKTKLQKLSSRESFEERLKTFHSVTYFCKPTVLSPMVCARFGYVYSQKWNGVEWNEFVGLFAQEKEASFVSFGQAAQQTDAQREEPCGAHAPSRPSLFGSVRCHSVSEKIFFVCNIFFLLENTAR